MRCCGLLVLVAIAAAGCGKSDPAPEAVAIEEPEIIDPQVQTGKLLAVLDSIDLEIAQRELLLLKRKSIRMESQISGGSDQTREDETSDILKAAKAEAEAIREELYKHSEYKTPRLDEIRHNEIDHSALAERAGGVVKRIGEAAEHIREKR